jgi:hypothetical protein
VRLSRKDSEEEEFQDNLAHSACLWNFTYFNPAHEIGRAPWLTLSQWDAEPVFCRSDRIAQHDDLLFNRLMKPPDKKCLK